MVVDDIGCVTRCIGQSGGTQDLEGDTRRNLDKGMNEERTKTYQVLSPTRAPQVSARRSALPAKSPQRVMSIVRV